MTRRIAITRDFGEAIARCELTHLEREPIDVESARAQHAAYEEGLRELGCEVHRLPHHPALPDAVFVEDTAVVLEEVAIVTRPGAPSRRPETAEVAAALAAYRPLLRIDPPGTLDGGDVLVLGRDVYVGRSGRSNEAGTAALREHLEPLGYRVRPVDVGGCLHLKSAVTRIGPRTLLLNPRWVDAGCFEGWRSVPVDPAEPFAANALAVGDRVLYPDAYPGTRIRLEEAGCDVVPVTVSELAKAEGGVTCCSLVFRA